MKWHFARLNISKCLCNSFNQNSEALENSKIQSSIGEFAPDNEFSSSTNKLFNDCFVFHYALAWTSGEGDGAPLDFGNI